jgi:orotate phosphoribosyltransferase
MKTRTQREELLDQIAKLAFHKGDFTLASGEKSNYYINMKKILSMPRPLCIIVDLLMEQMEPILKRLHFAQIGGKAIGSIPITSAILYGAGGVYNYPHISGFYVREPKNHGNTQPIEGFVDQQSDILLVDDVLTSGKSVISVIDTIECYFNDYTATGWLGKVHAVYSVVNRSEKPDEIFKNYGCEYHYLFDLPEIIKYNESLKI